MQLPFGVCRKWGVQILKKNEFRGLSNLKDTNITVEVNDQTNVATLNINRPPVNTFNLEMLQNFCESIRHVEDSKCRALVLTSGCSRIFTAGLDIMEMYKPDKERLEMFYTAFQDSWLALYSCSIPTVALINGHSAALGCVYATCCDFRIMLPNFTIGLNETKLGLVAPKFVMASFYNVLPRRSAELALTQGRMFTSEEALENGLIDDVAQTKDEALNKSLEYFATYATTNPMASALTKQQIRSIDVEEFERDRYQDLNNFLSLVTEPNFQKRLGMYLEGLRKKNKKV